MKWSEEAERAVAGVPFFVRKRVRARVEEIAAANGRKLVTVADVKTAQQRFINKMAEEVVGYRLENCFGTGGCAHRIDDSAALVERIETVLRQADLLAFLRDQVGNRIKFHHELRVALADCPNACSQPQIRDIAIIGACTPQVTEIDCSQCGQCSQSCREEAIALDDGQPPVIDSCRCVHCGQCIPVCPTGTLAVGRKGYRVQIGGKLGRHPRLARELPGIFDADRVIWMIERIVDYYKCHSRGGQRLGELLDDSGWQQLSALLQVSPRTDCAPGLP